VKAAATELLRAIAQTFGWAELERAFEELRAENVNEPKPAKRRPRRSPREAARLADEIARRRAEKLLGG
jgi:hypothetical protein